MRLTGTRAFRLLLHPPGEGQWNMAVDEALLESVAAGPPVVRFYGFSPATLSLGRFQRLRAQLDREALVREGVTLVRRPTGGQAVLHDEELTYAVALGRGHLEPFGKREVYRFVAALLLRGLRHLGVPGLSARSRSGSMHNPDCFGATGEYEIATLSRRKLIGSAQILTRRGSLQHGAIPLSDSYRGLGRFLRPPEGAPSGPGPDEARHEEPSHLGAELRRSVSFREAQEGFAAGFAEALGELGVTLIAEELSEGERRRAQELREERYGRDEWNLMY